MIYLKEVLRKREDNLSHYPFNIERINKLESFEFVTPITIFIGENGSGKTTFLESIVHLTNTVNLIPDKKLELGKKLSKSFSLVWNQKANRGFYLKSQSFITYIRDLEEMKAHTKNELEKLKETYKNRSIFAFNQVTMPYRNTLSALEDRYGLGLENMSHGEGYLELFKSRLVPKGLYILDEPELSLSPIRQLSLIALINTMVQQECQFIMITHSPILMAINHSKIYSFDSVEIEEISYDDIEHVKLTRDFLNNPAQYLNHLD